MFGIYISTNYPFRHSPEKFIPSCHLPPREVAEGSIYLQQVNSVRSFSALSADIIQLTPCLFLRLFFVVVEGAQAVDLRWRR